MFKTSKLSAGGAAVPVDLNTPLSTLFFLTGIQQHTGANWHFDLSAGLQRGEQPLLRPWPVPLLRSGGVHLNEGRRAGD